MAELVKLQNSIVNRMEIEVGCYNIAVYIVCGVLHRAKIINSLVTRHNNHTRRVLTCGAFNLCMLYH